MVPTDVRPRLEQAVVARVSSTAPAASRVRRRRRGVRAGDWDAGTDMSGPRLYGRAAAVSAASLPPARCSGIRCAPWIARPGEGTPTHHISPSPCVVRTHRPGGRALPSVYADRDRLSAVLPCRGWGDRIVRYRRRTGWGVIAAVTAVPAGLLGWGAAASAAAYPS